MTSDEESDFDMDDDYEYDYDEEPAAPTPASGPQAWLQSAVQRIRGTKGTSGAPMTEREAKRAIYMVNERERRLSFASAVVAVGFGVAIYVSETSNKNFRLNKGQLTPQTMLLIGIAAGALLIVATLVGRRALVGFMVFFAGAAFSTNSFVLALPFWALAFYLLYRSSRIQRQRTQELRAERAARPRSANTRGSNRRASGSGKAKGKAGSSSGSKRPEANKRYTPPRPPPKPKPAPPARRPKKTTAKKTTAKKPPSKND